jgi:hypothetical protein
LKQPLRHLAKQRVAGGMSLAVIDFATLQVYPRCLICNLTN